MHIGLALVVLGVALIGWTQGHNQDWPISTHRRRSLITPTTPSRRQSNLGKDIYRTLQDLFRTRRASNALYSRDQHVLGSGEKLYCVAPKQAAASASSFSTAIPSSSQSSPSSDFSSSIDSPTTSTAQSSSTSTTSTPSSDDSTPSSSSFFSLTTISTSTPRTTPISNSPTPTSSSRPPPPSPSWKVSQSYSGADFFNKWNFMVGDDPTFGQVSFVDAGTAQAHGLAHVNSAGNFVMSVETTGTVSNKRESIRITSQASYTQGLVVLDAVHMPTGCGTWPAFWSNGPGQWPDGGEIDIVENVNDVSVNQMTLHTSAGCSLSSADSNVLGQTGQVINGFTNCGDDGRIGCAVRSSDSRSFGSGFNAAGGGTYAMRWDNSGIAVWFWPAGSVPGDLSGGSPNPDGWGQPVAHFATGACDYSQHFGPQSMIFDTTLCGQWASPSWTQAGLTGQEQSCAQRTGFSTCEAYVQANGGALAQAYWEVRSVKLYQWST